MLLLCHTFKLYDRLILQRIQTNLDSKLVSQQEGFRPGSSCRAQILNPTEYNDASFEIEHKRGITLVDLSAEYDTVSYKFLPQKMCKTLKDYRLIKIIESVLQNRFPCRYRSQEEQMRHQKIGLPQGTVLAHLSSVYTQMTSHSLNIFTKYFVYANDLAAAGLDYSLQAVEETMENAPSPIAQYYKNNSLKPNPWKTQVRAFQLITRQTRRNLKIAWIEKELIWNMWTNRSILVDRSLTYKFHCKKGKQTFVARNSPLKKLCHSK